MTTKMRLPILAGMGFVAMSSIALHGCGASGGDSSGGTPTAGEGGPSGGGGQSGGAAVGGPGGGGGGVTGNGGSAGGAGRGGAAGATPGTGGAAGGSPGTGGAGGATPGTGGAAPPAVLGGMPCKPPAAGPAGTASGMGKMEGELRQHHLLSITFDGPMSSDTASNPNPFLDLRLTVEVKTPSGKTMVLPGYFAADGNGGAMGNKWRVHFNGAETGKYTYKASFRSAVGVAIDLSPTAGTAMAPDGEAGEFSLGPTDKAGNDFRCSGKVRYVGEHYLRTADGRIWIKTGVDSPEDAFGYAGFANTKDNGGLLKGFLHTYMPHVADWKAGDPDWGNGAGKGLIGGINYLSSAGVNSMYITVNNIGADGDNTYPYTAYGERTHFDNAKLHQWHIVMEHMTARGVAFHTVLSESENHSMLDGGQLGPTKKIYYRELVARFSHIGGIWWNIGEENGNTAAARISFSGYLKAIDPYANPVSVHNVPGQDDALWTPHLTDKNFEMTSLQASPTSTAAHAEKWRAASAKAGHPWITNHDEQTPAGTGVSICRNPGEGNCDAIRKSSIWPGFLSGLGGIEWYYGYGTSETDVSLNDWRSRTAMYKFAAVARAFLEPLPVHQMQPNDALLTPAGGQVFSKAGEAYAIYLPAGGMAQLDLTADPATFKLRWYNVMDGTYKDGGMVVGGKKVDLPAPAGEVAAVLQK